MVGYAEVMASFPFPSHDDVEKIGANGGFNKWLENYKDITGDLHKIQWYRIVLDEACVAYGLWD